MRFDRAAYVERNPIDYLIHQPKPFHAIATRHDFALDPAIANLP
jgi:hypothetical protein